MGELPELWKVFRKFDLDVMVRLFNFVLLNWVKVFRNSDSSEFVLRLVESNVY